MPEFFSVRRIVPLVLCALFASALGAVPATAAPKTAAAAAPGVRYTNPLVEQRADPHIFKHTDGHYYYTATVPEYDRIILRRSTTIQGLATAPEKVIWTKHPTGEMGAHIWAPEIHFIDGRWYVYFAAGNAEDVWRIRMYVLENAASDPFTGTWQEKGRIATPWDTFSLDATTFTHRGTRYLVWAQNPPGTDINSGIYIAKMADPWTISGQPALLSTPTYDWETRGFKVNEGPAVIERNGRVWMTFSASATDSNYCMGLLSAPSSADLLDPASWTKNPQPVFTGNDATGQYGPGHNSFTTSEDGLSDILVYHDRDYRDIVGDPLDDPNRRTRVQKLYWNADGSPNFGIPVSDGATPYRLAAHNYPEHHIRHRGSQVVLESGTDDLPASQFRIVPGLTGSGTVALESADDPGHFLRRQGAEVRLERNDGSAAFAADASFRQRAGLADAQAVSFESVSRPGEYLRHQYLQLRITAAADGLGRADATFRLE
jgi:GH43 family beta-xylosidase